MSQQLSVGVQNLFDRTKDLLELVDSLNLLGDVDMYTEIARRMFTHEAERESPFVEEFLDES